jgi:anti-anti-sigma factor
MVQDRDGVAIVEFRDNAMLDSVTVNTIGDELNALVGTPDRRGILLDFTNAHFVSSPALSMILSLRRKSDQAHIDVVLCCLRPDVARLFRITKLEKLFVFFDSVEAALAHFQK